VALETTQSTGLSGQYQVYFSKQMLKHAVQLLVMDQFASKSSFPRNAGATQIRFFRADAGSRSNVQSLSEGIPISTFRDTTLTPVTATMAQYGEAVKISDILTYTDLFDTLNQGIQSMGEDAALHADFIVTSAVAPNVNASNKHYSGGAANFNALNALTAAQGAMAIVDLLWCLTRLKIARAPYAKGGVYVAVVPPQLSFDIMQDAKFVDSSKYGSTKGLFNGEIGMWYGIRIVESTQPWTEAGTNGTEGTFGTGGTGGTIYTSLVIGGQSYGVPILSGQSPFDPKIIINDKPDKSDPLNQFITAGWKAYYASLLLNDTWVVANRSKTTYA
jgi:N4-gp56 family major capsid protein